MQFLSFKELVTCWDRDLVSLRTLLFNSGIPFHFELQSNMATHKAISLNEYPVNATYNQKRKIRRFGKETKPS